jgi:hypothetical protein
VEGVDTELEELFRRGPALAEKLKSVDFWGF